MSEQETREKVRQAIRDAVGPWTADRIIEVLDGLELIPKPVRMDEPKQLGSVVMTDYGPATNVGIDSEAHWHLSVAPIRRAWGDLRGPRPLTDAEWVSCGGRPGLPDGYVAVRVDDLSEDEDVQFYRGLDNDNYGVTDRLLSRAIAAWDAQRKGGAQ